MLNELSQVVEALERVGVSPEPRHPRINPMGKNKDLLVVCLGSNGEPERVETLAGNVAAGLFRVAHGSEGSSFPGFNLPTPLRCLDRAAVKELVPAVEHVLSFSRKKDTSARDLLLAVAALFKLSRPREFSGSETRRFERSCGELVEELQQIVTEAVPGLANFSKLLDLVAGQKTTLGIFAGQLSELLVAGKYDGNRDALLLFQDILFGALDWKKRQIAIGTPAYWQEKAKHDRDAKQPVYLDLASPAAHCKRVAHSATSALMNQALLDSETSSDVPEADGESDAVDAFTGKATGLVDKFPSPKVVELGYLKLSCPRPLPIEGCQGIPCRQDHRTEDERRLAISGRRGASRNDLPGDSKCTP